MSPERWQQVKRIFQSAVARPPCERAEFLAGACVGGGESLRRDVEALLASDEQVGDFIEESAFEVAARVLAKAQAEMAAGWRIGPYRIVREIGHGGMGVVYLAERADGQFEKRVALKLIKHGLDMDPILRRFRHERQILADLDHPNIARLLDGGTTEDGLPYLVMEYIEGEPITAYCDRRKLPVIERLKLFRTICLAVHYAHQHLVVHRDLKPGNIMVTADGTPKLLDFGIAKLLAPEQAARSGEHTTTFLPLMTPEYASPEQVRGERVTTASDTYSLGVVLYELLTGRRPYRVKSRLPHEIAQAICEQEIEKPSTAVSRVEEALITNGTNPVSLSPERVSETRDGQSEKLHRRLRGDMDNIVLMALRKEPQRRYASVEQFSEDIRRHLEGLPIIARQDALSYRAGKFIQRHKAGVAAAVLVVLALLFGIIAATWQARVAQAERARAERRFNDVRELANSFMFEFHDAIKDLPGATPARQLLVNKALAYLDKLAREAGDDPSLQRELASAYQKVGEIQYVIQDGKNTGNTAAALTSHRKALAIREALVAANPKDTQARSDLAITYTLIGEVLLNGGDMAGAIESNRKGLAIREALAAANPADAQNRFALASGYRRSFILLATKGDYTEADQNLLKAVEICEALFAADPSNTQVLYELIKGHQHLDDEMWLQGNRAQAWESVRRALALSEEWADNDPLNQTARRNVYNSHLSFGDMLLRYGDPMTALAHYRQMLTLTQDMSVRDPLNILSRRDLALTYSRIGDALVASGDPAVGIEYYRKNIAINEALAASDPARTLFRRDLGEAYTVFGTLLKTTGETVRALEYGRKAQEIHETLLKAEPNHEPIQMNAARAFYLLAQLLTQAGRAAEARGFTTRALAIQQAEADKPNALGDRINNYAWSLLTCEPADMRAPAAALSYARRAAESTHENDPNILKTLALAYHTNGDEIPAIAAAEKALALLPPPASGKGTSMLRRDLEAQIAESKSAARSRRSR